MIGRSGAAGLAVKLPLPCETSEVPIAAVEAVILPSPRKALMVVVWLLCCGSWSVGMVVVGDVVVPCCAVVVAVTH